ncbi:MAG: cellulose synthase catalytic subunit [Pseudomonadota bacterium]
MINEIMMRMKLVRHGWTGYRRRAGWRDSQPKSPSAPADYFRAYEQVVPPELPAMSARRTVLWQLSAAFTLGLGVWYLFWRWTASLNLEAYGFSILVAGAETLMFLGTLLYFFDIWEEADSSERPPPRNPLDVGLRGEDHLLVDIFVATYDEDLAVLEATLTDACAVRVPVGWRCEIHLLDDGNRPLMAALAARFGVNYIARKDNRGYKAGNLRNALFQTDGEFIVICDADTRLFPDFLKNTLGYFRDPDVAWVQTPHWFYDVPQGEPWGARFPSWAAPLARMLAFLSGTPRRGADPFLSGSMLFFDIIQRRRNRHGASFCCGAGSIHRREPLFEDALSRHRADRAEANTSRAWHPTLTPLQPFRFHVSEDIYTSMLLHGSEDRRWRSVYHPRIECKMLSPWSMEAWAGQKLKYAGGTIDLMLRSNPLLNRHMPLVTKLHYAATLWSYLSSFVLLILMVAPVVTLFTGLSPVAAYSTAFFLHLLPLLLANELALALGAKGQDGNQGRILALAALPVTLKAFCLVVLGRKVQFQPTPKTPIFSGALRFIWPHLAILAVMAAAAIYGLYAHLTGSRAHTASLLIVNYFWLSWCALALASAVRAAFWRPQAGDKSKHITTRHLNPREARP